MKNFQLTSIFNFARKCGWCAPIRLFKCVNGVGVPACADALSVEECVLPWSGCWGNSSPLSSSWRSGSDRSSSWCDWKQTRYWLNQASLRSWSFLISPSLYDIIIRKFSREKKKKEERALDRSMLLAGGEEEVKGTESSLRLRTGNAFNFPFLFI